MRPIRTALMALAVATALAACSRPAEAPPASADATAPAATAQSAASAATNDASTADTTPIKAMSGTYTLDPQHTNVLAQWSHFGFSRPSAQLPISEGTLVYDAADPSRSSVTVVLPISGINTFVADLDKHLQGGDFFDAGKFADARFASTKVTAAGTNRFTVVGDLTIKDQTHPVTLDVALNGGGEHPMLKQQAIGFTATGRIKRSDFGVGAFAPAVSDEVELRITTEGVLKAPAAEPATAVVEG